MGEALRGRKISLSVLQEVGRMRTGVRQVERMVCKRMAQNNDDNSIKRKAAETDEVVDMVINVFDGREIIENCTVEIWHNSITDEYSIGWWKNDSGITGGGDSTDPDTGGK